MLIPLLFLLDVSSQDPSAPAPSALHPADQYSQEQVAYGNARPLLDAAPVPITFGQVSVPPPLDGLWSVDLSTDPDMPYRKPMMLRLSPDGSVTGTFYDSQIEAGRWTSRRGRTCAAFRTTDGVGPYHTTVCAVEDHAEGQTWAEHRDFVFLWRAEAIFEQISD